MPSANGVYSLPAGYLAVTGATIQASQHNPPLEDIAAALTARLSRDGTAAMNGALQLFVGTVGSPGAVFSTDLTTGLYKTTNGIGVSVSGVKVGEFLAGGINGARFLGELIPYTGTAAHALTVLPFGQTLSRTTYADLWTFAQVEIAAGNTFYNNGNGSTTFGIGDMRGRAPFGWDKMGGSAAGRLTTAGSGVDGSTLGVGAGLQTATLLTANLPPYTPTISSLTVSVQGQYDLGGTDHAGSVLVNGSVALGVNNTSSGVGAITGTMNPQGGTSTPVAIIPPAMVTNYLLYAGA